VRRLIEEIHSQGIVMAVASAAIASNVKFLIDALGLRGYFRQTLAVDSTTHPKPHPEIYLKTAKMLGVDPANCLVFEDSFVGIEAAKTRRDEMHRHHLHVSGRRSPPRNPRGLDCLQL